MPKQRDLADRIADAVRAHPAVQDVRLVGSRATRTGTPASDWDFLVTTADPTAVLLELPRLCAAAKPLGTLLDPRRRRTSFSIILPGPLKVDLHLDASHDREPPWVVGAETLASIDLHFWDWLWWLADEPRRNDEALVERELRDIAAFILEPLGIRNAPASIADAVAAYLRGRTAASKALAVRVDTRLGREVVRGLERLGIPVPTGG